MGEGGIDEVLVGGHPEDLGGATNRIDFEHSIESADIKPGIREGRPRPKQVRGPLLQTDGSPCGDSGEL